MNGCQRLLLAAWLLVSIADLGETACAQDSTESTAHPAIGSILSGQGFGQPADGAQHYTPVALQSLSCDQASGCDAPSVEEPFSAEKLKKLMKPIFSFEGEWYGRTDDVELATYKGRVRIPSYPIFGPPPPFFSVGFGYTDIKSPVAFDLPSDLYESSLGVSWMRKRNERWMFRTWLGVANATDGDNNSSDAWQFRGGIFAIYQPCQEWTWTFGAIALGRNDIPVVPAIGLIHQPRPELRVDLMFPRPRISYMLTDNGTRQNWCYLGGGLNGGTWAYQQDSGLNDQLTYRAWQLVIGWESTPGLQPGMPFALGRKYGVEFGYAFARKFEFEGTRASIDLGDTLILRATMSL